MEILHEYCMRLSGRQAARLSAGKTHTGKLLNYVFNSFLLLQPLSESLLLFCFFFVFFLFNAVVIQIVVLISEFHLGCA